MSKLEYRDIKQPNYRHVGKYTPRKDAKDIVTGKAIFLDDFSVPHMLYGKTKRSPYPHARILSIDTSRQKPCRAYGLSSPTRTCRSSGDWAFLYTGF